MQRFEQMLDDRLVSDYGISGGCIGKSRIVTFASGLKAFLKSYGETPGQCISEAHGLSELAKSGAIRIPSIMYYDDSVILLEFIEPGVSGKNFFTLFGRAFARLHQTTSSDFGFFENNFIGSTPQINLPKTRSWHSFFLNNRILYQIDLAKKNGYADSAFLTAFDRAGKTIDSLLSESCEPPSLLHGDLWSGNFLVDSSGAPVLIDPAVYYGSREADLAMTKLFGGFPQEFYRSYNDEFPLLPGWQEREDIYKLYHILNHLNIFGRSYYPQAISIIRSFC